MILSTHSCVRVRVYMRNLLGMRVVKDAVVVCRSYVQGFRLRYEGLDLGMSLDLGMRVHVYVSGFRLKGLGCVAYRFQA